MKHPKKQKRFVALLAAVMTGLVGATSVFAYEAADPVQVLQELRPKLDYSLTEKHTEEPIVNNLDGENVFQDIDGNVYEIKSEQERALSMNMWMLLCQLTNVIPMAAVQHVTMTLSAVKGVPH